METGETRAVDAQQDELALFAAAGFRAEAAAERFLETQSAAAARAYVERLAALRGTAGAALQRKVFRHYPKFVAAARDLRLVEASLTALRRDLGKTEFVLQSVERAAADLERLHDFEEARLQAAKRREKERRSLLLQHSDEDAIAASSPSSRASTLASAVPILAGALQFYAGVDNAHQKRRGIGASLENSRFKKVQALYCEEDGPSKFELAWVIRAPDRLDLLLHNSLYQEAVDLIKKVRKTDLDTFQRDLEFKMQNGEDLDTFVLDEQLWALHFAKDMTEMKAGNFLDWLLSKLEQNEELQLPRFSEAGAAQRMHPVVYLRALGKHELACRGFLAGKRRRNQEISSEVMYSPLATDPEQCILELAESIFKELLEANLSFKELFVETGDNENKEEEELKELDDSEPIPNTLQSLFLVWSKEEVVRFCANFVRFLLPGCKSENVEQAKSIIGGDETMLQTKQDSQSTEDGDDMSAVAMKGIPFRSEQRELENLLNLSLEEWRMLGSCLRWTLLLCRRLEKEGMILGFVVARQLKVPLYTAIESLFEHAEKDIRSCLRRETWQTALLQVETREGESSPGVSLTKSAQKLYELVNEIFSKLMRIYSSSFVTSTIALEKRITCCMASMLSVYLDNLVHAAGAWPATLDSSREKFEEFVMAGARRGEGYQSICSKFERPLSYRERRVVSILMSEPYSNAQSFSIISNALYVSTDLIPRVRENFEKLFKKQVPVLRNLETSSGSLENDSSHWRMLCDALVTRISSKLLEDVLQWSNFDYTAKAKISSEMSPNFERLTNELVELKTLASEKLGGHSCALDILASITEFMLEKLTANGSPGTIFGPVEGKENASRLSADVHLLLKLPETLVDREVAKTAQKMADMILEGTNAKNLLSK